MQTPALGISSAHDETPCTSMEAHLHATVRLTWLAVTDTDGLIHANPSSMPLDACCLVWFLIPLLSTAGRTIWTFSGYRGNVGYKLYRLLWPDKNPQGIVAKEASALTTVFGRTLTAAVGGITPHSIYQHQLLWTWPEVTRQRERQGVWMDWEFANLMSINYTDAVACSLT